MSKKLSYRQLEAKRLHGWTLFYIQDPADAETIFTVNPDMKPKDVAFIKLAYNFAKVLIEDFKANPLMKVNTRVTFFKKEIKEALMGKPRYEPKTLFD